MHPSDELAAGDCEADEEARDDQGPRGGEKRGTDGSMRVVSGARVVARQQWTRKWIGCGWGRTVCRQSHHSREPQQLHHGEAREHGVVLGRRDETRSSKGVRRCGKA